MKKHLLALMVPLALAGCAVDRSFGTASSVQVTDLAVLPEPIGENTYTIGPQEKIGITVAGAEDLSGEFLTDQNGDIVFPYLGKVAIGGKSPQDGADMIGAGLRGRIVIDPQVRIIPEKFVEPSISVGGEVEVPGSYAATGKPTLLKVINAARGLSDEAAKDDVLVMRTVDGQQYIAAYNLGAVARGNYPDPPLYANDIVMVGDSPARRRLETILGFAPILNPLILLVR